MNKVVSTEATQSSLHTIDLREVKLNEYDKNFIRQHSMIGLDADQARKRTIQTEYEKIKLRIESLSGDRLECEHQFQISERNFIDTVITMTRNDKYIVTQSPENNQIFKIEW